MRRTADCGVRGGFFYSGGSGDLADLVSALCGEYAVPADGGGGNDRDALHIHSDSDGAPAEGLRLGPADAAAGGVRVRVHDGFRLLVHRGCALPELPYAGRLVPCGHRACGGRCGF